MSNALAIDLYELTMAQAYFRRKRNSFATFDLFIRSRHRPFYVACGIDDALDALGALRFSQEDIDYLRSLDLFESDFLQYLKNFRFKGEVWSLEEPEIVFPTEPILRISANLIEAQLVESLLLNKINLGVTLATKAARVILAAEGRGVYDFSLRRTQGIEASVACAQYAYIVGAKGTSNVLAGFLHKLPVVGTMAHSYVMAFEREIESFVAFARQFPTKSILLIDTYSTKKGIDNAVHVAKLLRHMGFTLLGIRLDSGDLVSGAKYARSVLDREGLIDTLIVASGDLDEYKITQLVKQRAPIDAFGVGTHLGCSSDAPFTDVIYKLVAVRDKSKNFVPTMKLSQGKATLPGKKHTYRAYDAKGIMQGDTVVLEDEKAPGKRLMRRLMNNGTRLYKQKSLVDKRKTFLEKIKKVPHDLKKVHTDYVYPVALSKKLEAFSKNTQEETVKRTEKRVIFFDIDTQHDFLHKGGALYVKESERIVDNLKKLTAYARKSKLFVLSSQDTHQKDDIEFKEFGPHCVKGTKGYKKIKDTYLSKTKTISCKKSYTQRELKKILDQYPQVILEKRILNVFSNPSTLGIFETILPDEVYVYGVATDYCVKEAVEGLLKHDFSVFVVEDAVKEISEREKNKLFSYWRKKGVRFVTTDQVVATKKE